MRPLGALDRRHSIQLPRFLYRFKVYVIPWHLLASQVRHTPTPMGKKSPRGNCSLNSCVCSTSSWVCGFHSPGSPLHNWHGLQESSSFCARMGLLCENHQVYCYKFFLLQACRSFCSFVDYPSLWGLWSLWLVSPEGHRFTWQIHRYNSLTQGGVSRALQPWTS